MTRADTDHDDLSHDDLSDDLSHDDLAIDASTPSDEPPVDTPRSLTLRTGDIREFHWNWKGKPVTVVYEVIGTGKPILLLPAFSTISTRDEMRPLASALSDHYQAVLLDWAGFGQSARLGIHYAPAVYRSLLRDFVQALFPEPIVVIAAGHAAGYVMELAQKKPAPWSWVVLTAPTWRGPLPTMMGDRRNVFRFVRGLVRLPLIGQFLYFLNTLPPFLRWMMQRHVYTDSKRLTPDLIRRKWRVTQQRGARFAPAAFVTGGLDPIKSREDWLNWFQPLPVPVLMAIGEQMPPKSREEAEIIAHFCAVQVYRMRGTLGLHEEYAAELLEGILPFLNKYLSERD